LIKQFALSLSSGVIVLDTQEAGSPILLRLGTGVTEERENDGIDPAMHRRNFRYPPLVVLILQTGDKLVYRRNMRIQSVQFLVFQEDRVFHPSGHDVSRP